MKKCPTCSKQYEDSNTLCPADGAVLKKADDALVGQVLAGKYRIEEKIAEGGMGCVYRATHVLMEKPLAVKVLHPALAADDTIVARFTREAKAASRISHPHALTVTDFGEDEGGVVFLVMEYLRGRTLKEVVRAEGPLPLARVVEIVRQVSGALEAAHAEGVVHRDLKSDNIMLEESPGGDWAKVLDFGIAKIQEPVGVQDPGLTAPNLIIGTPQYMSPEQCSQASEIDARSDIYSLGIIIYEMLVGRVPFTGESPTAIMVKQMQETAPSVLEERKDLPPEVGSVVARALAKLPEERFQGAGQLSDALKLSAAGDDAGAGVVAARPAAEDTNRIVVPTEANEPPRVTGNEEYDEATVVSSPRHTSRHTRAVEPPPAQSFNPWKIALPSIAVLAVLFAVVFAFQRGGGDEGDQPPLTSDPNGRPVESITPPTGSAETNLVPAAGTPGAAPGQTGPAATGADGLPGATTGGENVNAAAPSPTPAQGDPETRDGEADDEPTPEEAETPANRNTNRRTAPPAPNVNADVETPPAPTPARRRNPPAPTVTPAADPPKQDDAPLPALPLR